MSDAGVYTVFEMHLCKMVRGAIVFMRGDHTETLYKLFRSVNLTECNNSIFPETDSIVPRLVDQTMLWKQRMGHSGEKGL